MTAEEIGTRLIALHSCLYCASFMIAIELCDQTEYQSPRLWLEAIIRVMFTERGGRG
jgi:hypothetical protein